jgi:hypothetical protein
MPFDPLQRHMTIFWFVVSAVNDTLVVPVPHSSTKVCVENVSPEMSKYQNEFVMFGMSTVKFPVNVGVKSCKTSAA